VLEAQAEAAGRPARGSDQRRIVDLGQIDEPSVVAEVLVAQLGMAVQAEPADDQPVEVAREEVGQEERRGFLLGQSREVGATRIELVAVGAREALHALLLDHRVEHAAGATVGVGDEHTVVAGPTAPDPVAHRRGDASWPVVQGGRQARDVDVGQVRGEGHELAREGAAAHDEDTGSVRRRGHGVRR